MTRQEAVDAAWLALTLREKYRGYTDPDILRADAEAAITASGLLDANNQLRQRLAEAEGLLADANRVIQGWGFVSTWEPAYDAYRIKYTPEPPE